MENPWVDNRNRSSEQLVDIFGVDPFENDRIQSYDFRPKKGSVFIDNGKIIEGINDGQEESFYHGESFFGQNRAYIGSAPDIGPYEYGDSVYWIPGYRYNYPSIPIPRNGAENVPIEYGLAWNYPWSENYNGVSATVTITGPGINDVRVFDYPNNVMFVDLMPNSSYNWSVSIQGIPGSVNGESWTFSTVDKIYPLNDRSVDMSIQDSTYLPSHMQNLEVSKNKFAFFKFDLPINLNIVNTIQFNVTPSYVGSNENGMVLYKFNDTTWTEKLDESNIGMLNLSNLTPLDTIFDLELNDEINIDIKDFISNNGLNSFALGMIDTPDVVSFYSKENLILEGGFNSTVQFHNSGYATNHNVWPSISIDIQDNLSVDDKLIPKTFALHQNYPNPFNPNTNIRFDLPKNTKVQIIVYDILGRLIKNIINKNQNAGFKSVQWDGKNNFGRKVPSGVYLYSIEAGDFNQTRKMLLIK